MAKINIYFYDANIFLYEGTKFAKSQDILSECQISLEAQVDTKFVKAQDLLSELKISL